MTTVSSAACALLIEWSSYANTQQKQLHFTHIPDKLTALIKISGLSDIISYQEEANG